MTRSCFGSSTVETLDSHIDGVGVADGDSVLLPPEFHFPGASERLGPS